MENATNPATVPAPVNKEPLLAAIGSFFIPGLGQVYNGEGMVKGLMYMIGSLIGYLIFFIPGLAIWLYGIYNAYTVADKMKSGQIPVKGTTTANLIIYVIIAIVIYIIYAVVLFIIMAFIAALFFSIANTTTYSY